MRLFGLFILCFIVNFTTSAQKTTFMVSAPEVVEVGEEISLKYVLNTEGEDVQLAKLEGFTLLMGPSLSTSISMSVINGKSEKKVEYVYTYLITADKEGEFTIPPATVKVDGKIVKSNAIKIKVIKGSGKKKSASQGNQIQTSNEISEENLFLRLEVSRNSLYVGESLIATLKVYSRVDLVDFGRSKFPAFNGFLAEEIKQPSNVRLNREEYNGKIYNVGVLQQTLLFPQHAGEITIEPFEMICVIQQRASSNAFDPFNGWFSNGHRVNVPRKTKPVKITVKNLPDAGKPLDFRGAVGNITLSTAMTPDTLTANEALTYKVTLQGSGNLKLLEAPKITFPHDFEVYDPKITRDVRGTSGTVTFEYLVIPRFAGDFSIPALTYSFFDTKTNTYKTLKGKEYVIHVLKGNETGNMPATNSAVQSFKKEDVKMLGEDIRFIKLGNSDLKVKGVRYFGTLAYWLSYLIPLVLFVVGMLLNRRRIKANADLVRVKSKTANKMAQKRLRAAMVALKAKNAELFYQEVLKALWGYMSFKLNIEASALNRDNISEHLVQRKMNPELVQQFINVLDHCEYARYAPGTNQGEEMEQVYRDSLTVITKMDKAI